MKSPCFISHFFLFSLLELFSPIVLLLDLKNHHFVIFVICSPLIRKKITRFVLEDCYLHFVIVTMKMMANTHLDSLFLHLSMRTSQICSILTPSLLNNRRHASPSSRTEWPARLPLSRLGRELMSLPSPVPAIVSQLLCLGKLCT